MEYLQFLEPWMIPIVIMICVTIIVTVSVIGNIITTSMKRKDGKNLSENKEFLNALRDFKESIDQRVSNLERIAASEKSPITPERKNKERQKQSAIELELDEEPNPEEETHQTSKLRNMLNQ